MSAMPKRDWREDYRALSDMTEDDLREAVEALPEAIRLKLAEGPLPYRYDCGVCEAFGKEYLNELKRNIETAPDPTDLKWRAFAYHEVPKKDMFRAEQQWSGPLAADTYKRTKATYRAAGYSPLASPPEDAVRDEKRVEAERERDLAREAEQDLRREWWSNHGHDFHALYGDDGELQCAACPADFKRQPITELRLLVLKARSAALTPEEPCYCAETSTRNCPRHANPEEPK